MNKISKNHAAANWYIANNFFVFPVKPKTKVPLTNDGFKSATQVKSQINKWWEAHPDANIGLATGKKFVVIDIDHKENLSAIDALANFESEFGPLPVTPHVLTGGGGYQFYFETDVEIPSKVAIRPNVDVRGSGGYVVAPPSIHPNGTKYEWESLHRICDVKIAKLPRKIQSLLLSESSNEKRQASFWNDLVKNRISEGYRNASLASVVGHLLRRYVDSSLVLELAHTFNQSRFKPPLPPAEVDRTVRSIAGLDERRKSLVGVRYEK